MVEIKIKSLARPHRWVQKLVENLNEDDLKELERLLGKIWFEVAFLKQLAYSERKLRWGESSKRESFENLKKSVNEFLTKFYGKTAEELFEEAIKIKREKDDLTDFFLKLGLDEIGMSENIHIALWSSKKDRPEKLITGLSKEDDLSTLIETLLGRYLRKDKGLGDFENEEELINYTKKLFYFGLAEQLSKAYRILNFYLYKREEEDLDTINDGIKLILKRLDQIEAKLETLETMLAQHTYEQSERVKEHIDERTEEVKDTVLAWYRKVKEELMKQAEKEAPKVLEQKLRELQRQLERVQEDVGFIAGEIKWEKGYY